MRVLNAKHVHVTAYSYEGAMRHEAVPKLGEIVLYEGKEKRVNELVATQESPTVWLVGFDLVEPPTDDPPIEDFQQRVIDEYKELTERRDKLAAFTFTPLFRSLEEAERQRLDEQLVHMNGYQRVLAARIHAMGLSHKIL
jgi:hypothetical protein